MNTNDSQKLNTLNEYVKEGAYHADLKLSKTWLPRYLRRFHVIKELLKQTTEKDAKIIDVGGGEGIFVDQLREEGFINSVGVDPYAPFTNDSMKRGSILELPFEDESFDCVTCLDVMEHIPLNQQGRASSELFRVLTKEGFGIVSVPNMAHFRSRLDFLLKGKPWRNRLDKHPGELSVQERIQVLKASGFTLLDTVGLHLTLSYDPSPGGLLGKAMTRVMFNAAVPVDLCWTTLILISKTKDSAVAQQCKGKKLLRGCLSSYVPTEVDPTYSAFH